MMEKQPQSSDETASYKEYPPSEIYTTSDPPPAYMKPRQTSIVQVARIAAYTLVAVSFILGSFILASSYVTATLSCQEYQPYPQEYIEDRLPRFQGLVADPLESEETKHHLLESADHRKDEEITKDQQAEQTQSKDEQADQSKEEKEQQTDDSEQQDEQEFKFKLPIHLDLDALTGALLEGNSKSKMNCVVEKQKSEEVMNKDQRELITFGLDLAALDPGLKHVTGERLAIVCETSREAPKESQPNQMVLPFPLPGFHPIQQRMMPQHMPQQMPPHMMHHQMPQNGLPRMPFQLPFYRPNPFQNFMPRQQIPQSIPRRGIEEIPILVLEDETRLQNLVELPRAGHPQIQNLVDLHRVNPQLSQIQNIVDLARGAAPALQNLIEIPENKPFHMIHSAVPEARNLPPWARPEVQDQVVQIQAMPAMMRPPQPSRPIQVEARPFHVESAAIQVEGRPIQVEGRPLHMEPRPVQMEHRPIRMEEHRPIQMEHRPVQMEHRPIQMEPRPIQMEHRPVQMESRPDGRHPEGRSLPIEGRVLPVPSDTVNPPPLPFEMQEPSRPHFVQPRSVRSVDNVLHRRDKRERRCACDCAC